MEMFRIPYRHRVGLWYDIETGTFNHVGTLFLNLGDARALAQHLVTQGLAASEPVAMEI
jgi:hypothetical protein